MTNALQHLHMLLFEHAFQNVGVHEWKKAAAGHLGYHGAGRGYRCLLCSAPTSAEHASTHATAEEVCADDLMRASDLRCSGAPSVRHNVFSQTQRPADSHHAHILLNTIRTPAENRSLVAFGRLSIFGGHPRGSIPLHALIVSRHS